MAERPARVWEHPTRVVVEADGFVGGWWEALHQAERLGVRRFRVWGGRHVVATVLLWRL